LMRKRAAMMQQWATFVRATPSEKVVPIRKRRSG
jgi:hypothetical protein